MGIVMDSTRVVYYINEEFQSKLPYYSGKLLRKKTFIDQ